MAVKVLMRDVVAQTPEGPSPRLDFPRQFTITLPPELKALEDHNVDYYRMLPDIRADQKVPLEREFIRVGNGVQSELHARCSFALSCLILVIVGCCLGMMFKSGNFLTAFALSVIPALVCIALIVAGQHTCENVPWRLENFQNPLHFGIAMIWSGNAVVLALAVTLGWKMQRQ
jgi:lipopolysaccharide export LptBFGC system permease protein LptF